jgi:hypothetical protein
MYCRVKKIVDRRFRGTCYLHHQGDESVDNYFTRQYIPEDKSELKLSCRGTCSVFLWAVTSYTFVERNDVSDKYSTSIFRAEDGDSVFLRNTGVYLRVYLASKPRRTSYIPPWETQISHSALNSYSCNISNPSHILFCAHLNRRTEGIGLNNGKLMLVWFRNYFT